ncbi:MAG: GAF domain-containing protein, partial [Bradyrhizobium sp.]
HSTTSNKAKGKGRKATKKTAPVAKRRSISSLLAQSDRYLQELTEARERQAATAEVLQVISGSISDAKPVFTKILDSCAKLFRSSGHILQLVGSDGLVYAGATSGALAAGKIERMYPFPLRGSATEWLLRERRTLSVPDVLGDHEFSSIRRLAEGMEIGTYSAAFAPLHWEGVGIGSLALMRQPLNAFTEKELEQLQIFADQAVIAIQNARLFNETKEVIEQQTATSNALQLISSSTFSLEPVFRTLVENAVRLCGAQTGMIFQRDDELMRLAAADGASEDFVNYVTNNPIAPRRDSVTGRAALERQTVHILDIDNDPEYAYAGKSLERYRSIVGVPLMRGEKPVGVFTLWRHHVQAFTPRQIALVETFANQAVIAIENARLFNETKEALERETATAEILKVIASSPDDIQPVFKAIAERSNRLVDALSTTVFGLVDDIMHLRAYTPTTPEADSSLEAIFPAPLATFDWGESIGRGDIYRVVDAEQELESVREVVRLRGWRSCLCIPLLRDGKPIGMIGSTRAEPGRFADHHVQLLQTFADQAVIAISNVGLFNEVQQRTRELSISLENLRAAQDRLVQTEKLASLGQLTAGIAHEIKNPLNFVNNFSSLSAELIDELDETLAPAPLDRKMRDEVGELTKMLKSNLEKVVQHGKRADAIVKNMLLHSRESAGEQRSANINALVDESLNLADHGARVELSAFNITLTRDLDPDAGSVQLYPQEITRALLNVISNGFYAAKKRKSEGLDETFEPVLRATTKDLGNRVEIRIRDNGIGIAPEVREKMFNPFFTTKPTGEGTGLGLSMTHDIIVKQHGGTIDVESEPGAFTEIVITLPR